MPQRTEKPSSDAAGTSNPVALIDQFCVPAAVVDVLGRVIRTNAAGSEAWSNCTSVGLLFSDVRFPEACPDWESVFRWLRTHGGTVSLDMGPPDEAQAKAPGKAYSILCMGLRSSPHHHCDRFLLVLETHDYATEEFEQTEMSRRLAVLGKLAAQVAHELNNPLDGILRYVNLGIRVAADSDHPKLKSYLTESRTGLMRMTQIIRELLEFTRNPDERLEPVNVNEIVEQAIRSHIGAAESNRVIIASDFQAQDMPKARGNRLFQVCSNLIRNAIDAMPNGGRLTITTGIRASMVVIRVQDTGPGLPADADQVFRAFFTTKELGKGTGIGLAICKEFVEDLGGTIHAVNGKQDQDGGAVFTVEIPVKRLVETQGESPGTLLTSLGAAPLAPAPLAPAPLAPGPTDSPGTTVIDITSAKPGQEPDPKNETKGQP